MSDYSKEAWIIIYTWESTEDWMGFYPDKLYQWFVCDYVESTLPKTFDTKEECEEYIKEGCLIMAVPFCVAGTQTIV